MKYPQFDENCLAAVHFNRLSENWDRVHLISKYKDGKYYKEWKETTWGEGATEINKLITCWNTLGVKPQEKVAILGKNRPRWISSCVSLIAANITFVPVYPTLLPDEIAYVLQDSASKYIVTDTLDQAKKVLEIFDDCPELKGIYVMDHMEESPDDRVQSYDELLSMADDKVDMEAIFGNIRTIKADDLVAIIYTSGTTGRPKGVMLSNHNFMSQRVVQPLFNLVKEDIFLNHLPFCHSFGFTADLLGSAEVGATLAIAEGLQPEQIRHALTTIRPTVLMSVPRLFEKLFVQVHQVVSSRPEKVQKLFHGALKIGKEVFDLKNTEQTVPFMLGIKYKLAKRILMKVRGRAGMDRIKVAYAGGGPTSKELCYFFQSLGIDLYQGYGLTETSPVANVNVPGKNKMGTVGPPIEHVEEKIADNGEILIRGPNVMTGYLNKPDATNEAVDEKGWFHTGDVGEFDEDGYLKITDRIKELIITSGGKNIAPLPIESAFNTEAYIERVVVIGDGRKYLSALLCPNFELLYDWAKEQDIAWNSDEELAFNPKVLAMLDERVKIVNQQLPRFQQIKKFAVIGYIFSEETGELTPTQKVKRRIVDEMHKDKIESLYEA